MRLLAGDDRVLLGAASSAVGIARRTRDTCETEPQVFEFVEAAVREASKEVFAGLNRLEFGGRRSLRVEERTASAVEVADGILAARRVLTVAAATRHQSEKHQDVSHEHIVSAKLSDVCGNACGTNSHAFTRTNPEAK